MAHGLKCLEEGCEGSVSPLSSRYYVCNRCFTTYTAGKRGYSKIPKPVKKSLSPVRTAVPQNARHRLKYNFSELYCSNLDAPGLDAPHLASKPQRARLRSGTSRYCV